MSATSADAISAYSCGLTAVPFTSPRFWITTFITISPSVDTAYISKMLGSSASMAFTSALSVPSASAPFSSAICSAV